MTGATLPAPLSCWKELRFTSQGLPETIKVDNVLPARASRLFGDSFPERDDSRYLPFFCYPSFASVASIF
jgi:hypothetical protein